MSEDYIDVIESILNRIEGQKICRTGWLIEKLSRIVKTEKKENVFFTIYLKKQNYERLCMFCEKNKLSITEGVRLLCNEGISYRKQKDQNTP